MREANYTNIKQIVADISHMPYPEYITRVPELLETDVDNSYSAAGKSPFKAVTFNMEAGTRIDKILLYLTRHPDLKDADIIFANELDWGMSRSGNRHISRDIAAALGMNYAYGIEFITALAGQNGNREGRHGNAIFSKFPLNNVTILRLPVLYDWFYRDDDCRLGNRVALLAHIQVEGQQVGIICVHLENRAAPAQRERQMSWLLEQAQIHFGNIPVLVGGDMNTNTVDGNAGGAFDVFVDNESEQARRRADIPALEPLMGCAQRYGYSYADCNLMDKTTRRKPMPDGSTINLNLDWFFQKGLTCMRPQRVETLFDHRALIGESADLKVYDGKELSDHDAIVVSCKAD